MSAQNRHDIKAARRSTRLFRKAQTATRFRSERRFGGVWVTKGDVLSQRYLASKGMEFSPTVAAVVLPATTKTRETTLPADSGLAAMFAAIAAAG